MQKLAHEIYSFDEFRLDLTRGALYRGTLELKLRPKSFDVLKYLTENQGRLVSKDELIDSVWLGTAVTDDSLVQCLKDIRQALDDQAQQIIKTVPRRGYIFESEVSENGAATTYTEETAGVHLVIEETEDTNGHGDEISGQRQLAVGRKSIIGAVRRHKTATALATVGLTAVVIAGIFFYKPVLAWWFKPPSIAVLPIINASGDAGIDYVSDGMTESIITSLVQLNTPGSTPRLRVTAYNTVNIFKGKEIEPRSVGQQLGVENVLVSKMFRQDRLSTFRFELINVGDGSIVWSKQYAVGVGYGVGLGDFMEMQNRVASDLAARLPLRLSDADRENLTRRYTQNSGAYDAYLKGREAFRKSTAPSSLIKSIEYYQQAIDLDPEFALAYWAMGVCYATQGIIGERPHTETNEKAVDLYRKALKIDNTLQAASNALKLNDLNSWNWEAIEKAGPRHPGYSSWQGGFLIAMGRLDEQLEIEKRALSFDPYNPPLNFSHAGTLFFARRYDEAIAQYHKTLNLRGDGIEHFGPESPWIHVGLGNTYAQKGMYSEAIVEMHKAKDLAEGSEGMMASLGYATAKSGQKDEAIKILNQLLERESGGEYVPPLNIAAIYIALDDKDRAFVYLEKAFDDRMGRLRLFKVHPFYDPIRSDPRFIDLIRRMGLPP